MAFVHPQACEEKIAERLLHRVGHFADGRRLPSQYAVLEPCPDALSLDAFLPVDAQVMRVVEGLGLVSIPASNGSYPLSFSQRA
jgi:gluconate kinase